MLRTQLPRCRLLRRPCVNLPGRFSSANPPEQEENWRTIPNALTALRLCAVPGIAVAWYVPAPGVAAGLFGAAAVTDWLDGYLARRWGQQSSLGALLDPLADKMLVSTTLVLLVEHVASPAVTVPAALILARELGVSSLREWSQKYRPEAKVSVAWHGKAKAALQMIALQGLLAALALGAHPKDETEDKKSQASMLYAGRRR
ncbi:unnamed protein product [Effrenium voratum]|nr:unnamed protein product [Effrenium voratum]CAJ1448305.1 unnamed protein product [Effrenium voratum]